MVAIEIKPGYLIDERYQITSLPLPPGGMATIYPAIDIHTNRSVAIKIAFSDSVALEGLYREAQTLRRLSPHPNIVAYIGETLVKDRHGLIVEWLDNELRNQISAYLNKPWPELMELIGYPLLNALRRAHSESIQHRDVHPGNIMFSHDGKLRLIDFGIAKIPKAGYDGKTLFLHGTPPYTPLVHNDSNAGFARDCYSAVVVFLSCIKGKVFSSYEEINDALKEINSADYPISIFQECLNDYPKNCPTNAGALRAKLQNWTDDRFPNSSTLRLIVKSPPQIDLGNTWKLTLEDLMSSSLIQIDENSEINHKPTLHIAGQRNFASFTLEDPQRGILQPVGRVTQLKGSWASGFTPLTVSLIEYSSIQSKGTPWHTFARAYSDAKEAEMARIEDQRKEFPFACWENYLSAEQEFLTSKPTILYYTKLSYINDREFFFEVNKKTPRNVVSEDASLIARNNKKNLIEILEIEENLVRARAKYKISLPSNGSFGIQYNALKHALGRKRRAFLSIRDGLSVSPLLREYIKNPTLLPATEMSGRNYGIDDEYQANAVDGSLSTSPLIIIEGPPGTGKSTVIAKIIEQYMASGILTKPKILLAAQTHIAIDTVLRKLLDDSGLADNIVRIPSGDLEKVHPQILPLLVANKVKSFREQAIIKSEIYLESLATSRGRDHRYIRLALYSGLYKSILEEEGQLLGELRSAETKIDRVVNEGDVDFESQPEVAALTVNLLTKEDNIREELDFLRDRLARLKEEISRNEPALLDAINSSDPISEISQFDEVFGPEIEKDPELATLVNLQLDWLKAISAGRALHQVVIQDAMIIAGTCVGIGSAINNQEFDVCIVDEASKALPVEAFIPMARAKKWILVGDSRQLPPHLDRELRIRPDEAEWVGDSLLQSLPRLVKNYTGDDKPSWYFELKTQRRMTRSISDLISTVFYQKELIPLREDRDRNKIIAKAFPYPVTWIDVNSKSEEDEERTRSLYNEKEINAVLRQLSHLERHAKPVAQNKALSVAIIAGYAAQVELLSTKIKQASHQWPRLDIEVATIDRFQGNEKDVAIVSLVRGTNVKTLGHLDEKRINVALSRAKDALVIVGSTQMVDRIGGDSKLAEVLDYIRKNRNACKITTP